MANQTTFNVQFRDPWAIWRMKVGAQLRKAMELVANHIVHGMQETHYGEDYAKYIHPVGGGPPSYFEWTASAGATDEYSSEYPAERTGDLINVLRSPQAIMVQSVNSQRISGTVTVPKGTSGRFSNDISEYAIDILDEGQGTVWYRPWRDKALLECEDQIKEILGLKLYAELNMEDKNMSVRARNRWDNYR